MKRLALLPLMFLGIPVSTARGVTGQAQDLPASSGERTFHLDNGVKEWTSLDPEAKILLATHKDHVRSGVGALEYRYRLREGGISLVGRLSPNVAGQTSLTFWAKCTHATGLSFGLSENNEARYGSAAYLPGNTWTRIAVNLDELQLADDSRDDNGRLDLDKVSLLWFVDVGVIAQALNPEIRGERTLWIDEVTFSRTPGPAAAGRSRASGEPAYLVDSFEGGLLRWLPLLVTFDPVKIVPYPRVRYEVTTDVAEVGGKAALKVSYPRPPTSAFALARDVHGLDLKATARITFWIRTETLGLFAASMEEVTGARYEQGFFVSPGRWTKVELPVDRFKLAEDSKDPDGGLDLATVKQFSIMDVNIQKRDAPENTLCLDEVVFAFRK